MASIFETFSNEIADAVVQSAAGTVQVAAHRRPVTGVVFAEDLVLAPASGLDDDEVVVRRGDGHTIQGHVLGRTAGASFCVVRAGTLGVPPITAAPEPRVGQLAIAVGRTWSGGVMASVTNIAVIGGPLRTGRTSSLERVIRVAQPPHGALTGGVLADGAGRAIGIITGAAIRGTAVVIPVAHAVALADAVVAQGGTRQGFLGVTTSTVSIPGKLRPGRSEAYGLIVNGLVEDGPADRGGLLLGDVLLSMDGVAVQDPEELVTRLRGNRVGQATTFSVLRAGVRQDVQVTIGERPLRRARR